MKKKLFSLSLVICCIALVAFSGTMAYFTADSTADNVVTTGKIDIDLREVTLEVDPQSGQPMPFEDVDGIMPSQAVDKIVTVHNINNAAPAFVRVSVATNITLAPKYAASQDVADNSLVTADFNTTDWTYLDGYWYYNQVLDKQSASEPLFTKVTFSEDMGNIYQGATVTIDIVAEAVQVKNNPGQTALTAQGWPEIQE
ncbi:MAG: SipW-dependent-type signal peptide-containing protein [Oscillospiraceae bacterium]|nr:SipW-dependent-type signal peptide-containing protein [Oscillospiraceae bacterium]